MNFEKTKPVILLIVTAALIAAVTAGADARGLVREPEAVSRCICVGGVPLEWREGSTIGPPGRGRLDWPGAHHRCRSTVWPAGSPGEKAGP